MNVKQEYLRSFHVKELNSQIQNAMDRVREASETMTERAKIAIKKSTKTSPRVDIKISLSAPVILVPLHSNSLRSLMLDLGHLEIRNSFSLHETKTEKPAVLDLIEINLNSLKFARSVFMPVYAFTFLDKTVSYFFAVQ